MSRILGRLALIFLLAGSVSAGTSNTGIFLNRIVGQVYDPDHRPLSDINVELYNEVDSLLGRTKTNSAGAFTFVGISRGTFQIRVLPFNTGLLGDTKQVNVAPLNVSGSDTEYVEFYLQYDKRRVSPVPKGPGEALFVQDIPDGAKKLFETGVRKLERGDKDGLVEVKGAVDAFPNYFDALSVLGREYINSGKYEDGYPYLLRAVDLYQRSPSVYYALAFAFYKLDHLDAALKSIDAALVLNGGSSDAHLLRGTILRLSKSYKESEQALLKSVSLNKKGAEAHWQLALLYNRTGRNAEAVDQLQQFLKLEPNSPDRKRVEDLMAKLKTRSPDQKSTKQQ